MNKDYINILSHTGLLVSLAALSLLCTTYTFFGTEIRPEILIIVFTGTYCIYNTDHIRGITSDKRSRPLRVRFIKNNRRVLVILTLLSFLVSSVAGLLYLSFKQISILLTVMVIGLLHRRLKHNYVLSSIYITASWICVVILMPLSGIIPDGILWFAFIVGTALHANALAYTMSTETLNGTNILKIPGLIAAAGCVSAIIAPHRFLPVICIPAVTLLVLLLFHKRENFELMYLDGSLIAGSVLSMFLLQL